MFNFKPEKIFMIEKNLNQLQKRYLFIHISKKSQSVV